MTSGQRWLCVSQARLFGATASGAQLQEFIDTGNLECSPSGSEPTIPYSQDVLKQLVESGRLG
jgi:hypothetical protein